MNILKTKNIFLIILLMILGMIYFFPQLDYQPFLSHRDHGRDLYCFQQTLKGAMPYRDYWWVYGPLMPYYYGLFFLIFGVTIKSVLIGKTVIAILNGILTYLILSKTTSKALGILGGLWLFVFGVDFFHTYNHIGAIAAILALAYCLISYSREQKRKYIYLSFFFIFLASIIKINFGVIFLPALYFIVGMTNFLTKNPDTFKKNRFYLLPLAGTIVGISAIYFLLAKDLPVYALRQCFPYLSPDHPNNTGLYPSISLLLHTIITNAGNNVINITFAFLIIVSAIKTVLFLSNKNEAIGTKKHVLLDILIILIFYVLSLHEYLASGLYYRSFWAQPYTLLLIFVLLHTAIKQLSRPIQNLLYLSLLLIIISSGASKYIKINLSKRPPEFLNMEHGKIFVNNPDDWINTVKQTVEFIEKNIKQDEYIFSIPYSPIYYYLTDKKSPTRQIIFFEHINIPREQEIKVINELESKNVTWVITSNDANIDMPGLGIFGRSYCPLIGEYIRNNFMLVQQFGEWDKPAGWAWNHAVRIYKKKQLKDPTRFQGAPN